MTDQADLLAQFSNALAARAEAANSAVVAICLRHGRHSPACCGDPTSSSPPSSRCRERMNLSWSRRAARPLTAKIAGRDPSTNIAILRPATPLAPPSIAAGEALTGALALAIGADGTWRRQRPARTCQSRRSRMAFQPRRPDRPAHRARYRLAQREEGGPVFDAAGNCLGMSTFGPRGQVIVDTDRNHRTGRAAARQGRPRRARLARRRLAGRRGARCAAQVRCTVLRA